MDSSMDPIHFKLVYGVFLTATVFTVLFIPLAQDQFRFYSIMT